MEYFIEQFVRMGGVFGLLAIGEFIVIAFLFKANTKLTSERVSAEQSRVQDLKDTQQVFHTQSEAVRATAETANKIAENTFAIVQNIQQLINLKGGKI